MTMESKKGEQTFDIDKLIDKSYSEMSDDEIEFVIDWKAKKKARDAQFQKTLDEMRKAQKEQVNELRKIADQSAKSADDLLKASIARINALAGGEVLKDESKEAQK